MTWLVTGGAGYIGATVVASLVEAAGGGARPRVRPRSGSRTESARGPRGRRRRAYLAAVVEAGVERFVFSSSAVVYGTPDVDRVGEDHPCAPINPYGETKLAGGWLIRDAARAHGLRATVESTWGSMHPS